LLVVAPLVLMSGGQDLLLIARVILGGGGCVEEVEPSRGGGQCGGVSALCGLTHWV
jgi:hypothetical protein